MTLVDANVLLDVLTDDPVWFEWSAYHLDAASVAGPLLINDVIYAEISVRFDDASRLDSMLEAKALQRRPFSTSALFLAPRLSAFIGDAAVRGPAYCPIFS